MPFKNLNGPATRATTQRALGKEIAQRLRNLLRRRPRRPDDDGLLLVSPPPGPQPMPLAGAAEIEND